MKTIAITLMCFMVNTMSVQCADADTVRISKQRTNEELAMIWYNVQGKDVTLAVQQCDGELAMHNASELIVYSDSTTWKEGDAQITVSTDDIIMVSVLPEEPIGALSAPSFDHTAWVFEH